MNGARIDGVHYRASISGERLEQLRAEGHHVTTGGGAHDEVCMRSVGVCRHGVEWLPPAPDPLEQARAALAEARSVRVATEAHLSTVRALERRDAQMRSDVAAAMLADDLGM